MQTSGPQYLFYSAEELGLPQEDGSVLYPRALQAQYPEVVAYYQTPYEGLQPVRLYQDYSQMPVYQVKGLFGGGAGEGALIGAGVGGLAGGLAGGLPGLAVGALGGAAIGGLAGGLL